MAVIPVVNDRFTLIKDDWDARIDQGTRGPDLVLQVRDQCNRAGFFNSCRLIP